MKNLGFILLGGAVALLASCHAAPDKTTPTAAAGQAPAVVAKETSTAEPVAKQSFAGYRRFRGTVGDQPVTVELTIGPSNNSRKAATVCEGSYTYDRHPAGQLVLHGPQPFYPQRSLVLIEADTVHPDIPTGRWEASQPAGAVLTGTWTSPAGRQLPFSLHEDYTDGQGHLVAVRYEIFMESVVGAPCLSEFYKGETKAEHRQRLKDQPTASFDRQYLYLLGPEAKQPALRLLQCPPPRQRRAALQQALKEAGDCMTVSDKLGVTYNDYGLLAFYEYHEEFYQGADHPNHGINATIYDLRTGETLALDGLLKPGTNHALRQLITRELQEEMELDASEVLHPAEGDSTNTELPRAGVGLSADGLIFQYGDDELGAYAYGMPSVTIPYAELIPLLRPDSPVARMLRQRGLWPSVGPKRQ